MSTANPSGTIGFGIVGAGSIANTHAQAIQSLADKHDLRLVGILARSQEKARLFAEKHGLPFYTDNPETFFARQDIQVVCIVTPSGAHLEPALQAIRAGKHLIVEKPLEITVARVDAMLAAAEQAGTLLGGIFQARQAAGSRALKQAVDAGRFGRLALCSAYVKWHRNADYYQGWKGSLALDGGGAVINQAIHAVDLLQWLVGMPSDVFAWKTRCVHQGIEAEDTASATFRFANGALGTLEATTAAWPGWARRIEICGELGSAAIEDERVVRWEFRDATAADAELIASRAHTATANTPIIGFDGHREQIADMVHALRTGAPLQVDGRQARNAVELVCALYESAESGRPVKLTG
jgi:UDP-N-acetyl-2-amino-2-deoxyglucuronate dehydrogenase